MISPNEKFQWYVFICGAFFFFFKEKRGLALFKTMHIIHRLTCKSFELKSCRAKKRQVKSCNWHHAQSHAILSELSEIWVVVISVFANVDQLWLMFWILTPKCNLLWLCMRWPFSESFTKICPLVHEIIFCSVWLAQPCDIYCICDVKKYTNFQQFTL